MERFEREYKEARKGHYTLYNEIEPIHFILKRIMPTKRYIDFVDRNSRNPKRVISFKESLLKRIRNHTCIDQRKKKLA
jgi:hypothetical protein